MTFNISTSINIAENTITELAERVANGEDFDDIYFNEVVPVWYQHNLLAYCLSEELVNMLYDEVMNRIEKNS